MSDSIQELLKELTEAPGVPGFEEPVREISIGAWMGWPSFPTIGWAASSSQAGHS